MSEQVFTLPDVGEGLTEAEIVSWAVAPGDPVELNQVVCEIETAKSVVELPSPYTGVVAEILASVGETVPVGQPILRVDTTGDEGAVQEPLSATDTEDEGGGAVLVGYGTGAPAKSRRRRRRRSETPAVRDEVTRAHVSETTQGHVLAKPPTRKLAKDHGIDLRDVSGSGSRGEVLREDVMRHVAQRDSADAPRGTSWGSGREERIPVKGMRKQIARAMSQSAFTAPHVSVFVDVDATRTMEFVQRLKGSPDFAGIRISPLLIMAKAIIWAIPRNPMVNATFTDEEITVHHYVNLGIAAATPRGLVVPNIKDAQNLSLCELARAIQTLTNTAREGRTTPADMQHGTITITNFGVFGVDSGTPIINPGEAGIIGMGAIRQKPWVVDGQVVPRWVTTVGGSFDHRVVDGDVISRFVADIASVLEEPALLLD